MSDTDKNKGNGKTPMDMAAEADALTGADQSLEDRSRSEDIDDDLEGSIKIDTEEEESDARLGGMRTPNNMETIAGLLLSGGKLTFQGGVAAAKASHKAKSKFAERVTSKQRQARIKQLNTLTENTQSFRDKMVEHTQKFGDLSGNAHAYFNDPRMAKKYPDSSERQKHSIALAAKQHAGLDGDLEAVLADFNNSYDGLKTQMGTNVHLTENIVRSPKKFKDLAQEQGADIEAILNNSMETLREAKSVQNISPGEDESLDSTFKERMENLEKQLREFLDKIKTVVANILGR